MPASETVSVEPKARSLPTECWPADDQKAWVAARRPSERLSRGGTGGHMKPITLDDIERRYGYFLDHLERCGELDPDKAAAAHVTPDLVETYLSELRSRVGSVTLYGSIYKLRRMAQLLDPRGDFAWLIEIEKDLELVMQPRSKSSRLVLTERLVEAGLSLLTEAQNTSSMTELIQARQVRNGLMLAKLAMHPIRLKNFADLEIGRNFIEINGCWWIVLSANETKENRPDERRIDDLIKHPMDLYLEKYRPLLASLGAPTNALWLSSHDGAPLTYSGVEKVITETARLTVGVSVSPHRFRNSIASSAAIHGGDNLHLASALLHHTDHRVTEEHYNRASAMSAARNLRKLIQGYKED